MSGSKSNQILLIASNLLGESLAQQIEESGIDSEVCLTSEKLVNDPSIVIWTTQENDLLSALQIEITKLKKYWPKTPFLLVLPEKVDYSTDDLLALECTGIIQNPNLSTLIEAINILQEGGRIVKISATNTAESKESRRELKSNTWFLNSGLYLINQDLRYITRCLSQDNSNKLVQLYLQGRKRELKLASTLIIFIWGTKTGKVNYLSKLNSISGKDSSSSDQDTFKADLVLKTRSSKEVWSTIFSKISSNTAQGITNSSGDILAIDCLNKSQQKNLITQLTIQLNNVIESLYNLKDTTTYLEYWEDIQLELKYEVVRNFIGSYLRIPRQASLTSISEEIIKSLDLDVNDPELPTPDLMLSPIIMSKPLLIDGQLIPPDDPRAINRIEMLISNWTIRTAEIISEELLAVCSKIPEIRGYFLNNKLISTRELERVRNQLNSQNRWKELIIVPIQLYESKRLLLKLTRNIISKEYITEPRDQEIKLLNWWQQQVILLVEARDAIAPQVHILIKSFGDLMVIILTKVIGRALGLVGKGIAIGMGRSFGKN